jgi:Tfp pilus assembly protein PilF
MGKYTDAVSEYEKAMKLEQVEGRLTAGMKAKLANAHKELGVSYLEIEEFENAKQEFLKALKIAPQYLDIRTLLGNTYIKMGKLEEAITELEKVVGMNPQYIDARIKLAVAHYKKGERETANKILKETLVFSPENEKVKAFLKLSEKE